TRTGPRTLKRREGFVSTKTSPSGKSYALNFGSGREAQENSPIANPMTKSGALWLFIHILLLAEVSKEPFLPFAFLEVLRKKRDFPPSARSIDDVMGNSHPRSPSTKVLDDFEAL